MVDDAEWRNLGRRGANDGPAGKVVGVPVGKVTHGADSNSGALITFTGSTPVSATNIQGRW